MIVDLDNYSGKYKLSKRFAAVKYKDIYFCYNSLLGTYGVIDKNTFKFLNSFRQRNKNESEHLLRLQNSGFQISELIKFYRKLAFLIPSENFEDFENKQIGKRVEKYKKYKNSKLYSLGFKITDACNFQCSYCIKNKCDDVWNLSKQYRSEWDKIKIVLDQFFNIVISNPKSRSAVIGFSGGEPLMGFELIKRIVKYAQNHLSLHKKVKFTITTNGSLINDETAKFFSKNNFFKIGVSLDGNQSANRGRKYKNGNDTYQDVVKGLRILSRYVNADNIIISATLSNENVKVLNKTFLDFLKSLGIKKLALEPNIVDLIDYDYNKIANKIFSLYKYGEAIGVVVDGYWKKSFSYLLTHKTSVAACDPIRGGAIAVMADGKIKPCIYSKEIYDNLRAIDSPSNYWNFISKMWVGRIKECAGCDLEGTCQGGCYLSRIMSNEIFEYRCFLYKKIFRLLILDLLKENYGKFKHVKK